MSNEDDFMDPSGAGNFLQRYNQARNARSGSESNTTDGSNASSNTNSSNNDKTGQPSSSAPANIRPSKPIAIGASSSAKDVWGSVFHPLGKSPTSANRYDLGRGQSAGPGQSASEQHAKGTGIDLDDRQID